MRVLAAFVLAFASSLVQAAPTLAAVRAEIEALLGKLESSRCEFNRNGGWYTGTDAKTHLLGKLEYLENGATTLRSTEQFIELAATSSSTSGRPYQVKCGADPAIPSAVWLKHELAAIRAARAQSVPAPK